MAISPNDTFTSGQILTAQECNQFPFGVVGLASSTTSYTLTTTETIATGMSVTFTAIANRYYKVTYFEPQAQTSSAASNTTLGIRKTNATGTILNLTTLGNETGADQSGLTCSIVTTLSAGSNTIVGTAYCSSTTGAPQLIRDATRTAQILVEDIGPA